MKPALTPVEEDELLAKVELRNSLSDKRLCEDYQIGRSTLWHALERARVRRQRLTTDNVTSPDEPPKSSLQAAFHGAAILA